MGPFSGRRLAVRTATAALLAAVAAGGMSIAAGGAYASVSGTAKGQPGPVYGAAPVKPWPASEAARGTAGTATNSSSRASAISASTAAGCGTHLLGNPGFETGSAAPWAATAGVINPNGAGETSHSGTWYAWLDGYGTTHTDTLSQTVTIPAGCTATTFSFWLHIDTAETTTTTQFDKLTITANGTTLATFSNLSHASGYTQHSYSLGSFAGQAVTLKFTGTEDASLQTSFVVDDTAVVTS
jgi:hypothetical protein